MAMSRDEKKEVPLSFELGMFLQDLTARCASDVDRWSAWVEQLPDSDEAAAALRDASDLIDGVRIWLSTQTPERT